MNVKQLELLHHVIDSLEHPEESPYYGWSPPAIVHKILADMLHEIEAIAQYDSSMKII